MQPHPGYRGTEHSTSGCVVVTGGRRVVTTTAHDARSSRRIDGTRGVPGHAVSPFGSIDLAGVAMGSGRTPQPSGVAVTRVFLRREWIVSGRSAYDDRCGAMAGGHRPPVRRLAYPRHKVEY